MKVRAVGYLVDKIGDRTGEAIDFQVTRTGAVVFTVLWYGYPGTHEVAAMDLESLN